MTRPFLAGAAICTWLLAWPAAAEPFQTFLDMCLATNADREAAGVRAKGAGWLPMPMDAEDVAELGLKDPILFINGDPSAVAEDAKTDEFEAMMTGWGDGKVMFGVGGVRMDICVVTSGIGDLEPFQARMTDTLGMSPVALDDKMELWAFSRQGSGFRSEASLVDADDEDIPRIARERKIYFAGVIPAGSSLVLMIGALRPED